ncbi:hypothetical protein [Streptomonospora salina]|uniref:hypothetical protein n=1 Tax=Streptomonospora salina TaxID=104205 RepID=UPI0036DE3E47
MPAAQSRVPRPRVPRLPRRRRAAEEDEDFFGISYEAGGPETAAAPDPGAASEGAGRTDGPPLRRE